MYIDESFDKLINLYDTLSKNDVGLIITGNFAVCANGRSNDIYDLEDKKLVLKLPSLVKACHDNNSRIVLQLNHVGRQAFSSSLKKGPSVGPSAVFDSAFGVMPKALDKEGIKEIRNAFINCAKIAYDCGFDGIQLHAAHGYLLSQFLSPRINKRRDEYGKDTSGRMRLIREITEGIKEKINDKFMLLIKINCHDLYSNGIEKAEFLNICKAAGKLFDAIEISSGTLESALNFYTYFKDESSYYREYAKEAKKVSGCKIILVGNNRNYETCSDILDNGDADFISVSKGLICEPNLFSRWKSGDTSDAKCTNCGTCLVKVYNSPLKCYFGNRLHAALDVHEYLLGWMEQGIKNIGCLRDDEGQIDVKPSS
jgi:2,4-dienoyl-CoA reductase-like NADH-dependent reductase (Old Yellow Enzyme family)